jgi:hypothetical protein
MECGRNRKTRWKNLEDVGIRHRDRIRKPLWSQFLGFSIQPTGDMQGRQTLLRRRSGAAEAVCNRVAAPKAIKANTFGAFATLCAPTVFL